MSNYRDDDDFDEVPPSPSNKSDMVNLESLQLMMYKAKSTMGDFKLALQGMDTTNLDNESLASPEPSPAPVRLVTPSTPPPRYADRSSWITASRGSGQESKHVESPKGDRTETKIRDPAPGLSTHVTVIRKKSPSVSFAPPRHVEKVVPKVPPSKQVRRPSHPPLPQLLQHNLPHLSTSHFRTQPITKKGRREKWEARMAKRREIKDHDQGEAPESRSDELRNCVLGRPMSVAVAILRIISLLQL